MGLPGKGSCAWGKEAALSGSHSSFPGLEHVGGWVRAARYVPLWLGLVSVGRVRSTCWWPVWLCPDGPRCVQTSVVPGTVPE